jgi:hypothetical protein
MGCRLQRRLLLLQPTRAGAETGFVYITLAANPQIPDSVGSTDHVLNLMAETHYIADLGEAWQPSEQSGGDIVDTKENEVVVDVLWVACWSRILVGNVATLTIWYCVYLLNQSLHPW